MSSSLFLHVSKRLSDAGLAWTDSDAASSVAFVPEDDYLRRLGAVIKSVRKMRDWSQEELGEKVGRDKNSISRWERGATSLAAYDLVQLWAALEIPAEWLLEPTDSISELDRRVAQLRRAAEEAARHDAALASGPTSAAGTAAPRGKR
jgi:transcriptional regulator with XRE-family HTH domain